MKIWYLISILFCLSSINILNEEKDATIYKLISQKEDDLIYRLICFDLKEEINILANQTSIELHQLNRIVYDHLKN